MGAICQETCDSDEFRDENARECKKCHFTCATCYREGAKGCLTCKDEFTFDEIRNKCVPNCDKGFYPFMGNNGRRCRSCNECKTCNENQCLSCKDGKFLKEG